MTNSKTDIDRWFPSGYRNSTVKKITYQNGIHRAGRIFLFCLLPRENAHSDDHGNDVDDGWWWLWDNRKMAWDCIKQKTRFRLWAHSVFDRFREECCFFVECECTTRSVNMHRILVEQLSHFRGGCFIFQTKKIEYLILYVNVKETSCGKK